jgi:hypothetical protein
VQRYSKTTSKQKGGRRYKEAVNHRVHLLNPEKRKKIKIKKTKKNRKKKENDFKALYGFKILRDDKLSTCNIKTSLRA